MATQRKRKNSTAAIVVGADPSVEAADVQTEVVEPPAENEKVAELRGQVQTLLDRFAKHQFSLDYETIVGYAERMTLHTYVQSGALDRDEVMQRSLGAQLAILQQEFQARCIRRDERQLVTPQQRAHDRAAETGRIVLLKHPRVIRPGE